MKKYTTPEIQVTVIEQDNTIMLSGVTGGVQDGSTNAFGTIPASQLDL